MISQFSIAIRGVPKAKSIEMLPFPYFFLRAVKIRESLPLNLLYRGKDNGIHYKF